MFTDSESGMSVNLFFSCGFIDSNVTWQRPNLLETFRNSPNDSLKKFSSAFNCCCRLESSSMDKEFMSTILDGAAAAAVVVELVELIEMNKKD